jgi:hypothetical protein
MTLNLAGLTVLPTLQFDVPSDATANYNVLVNQINSVLQAGGTATGPAFADTTTGNLAAALVTTQVLILVELRCIANFLDPTTMGDRNQMRADELFTLTNAPGGM